MPAEGLWSDGKWSWSYTGTYGTGEEYFPPAEWGWVKHDDPPHTYVPNEYFTPPPEWKPPAGWVPPKGWQKPEWWSADHDVCVVEEATKHEKEVAKQVRRPAGPAFHAPFKTTVLVNFILTFEIYSIFRGEISQTPTTSPDLT